MKQLLTLTMSVLLGATMARADMIAFSSNMAPQSVDFSYDFDLPQFNSSLGILTSVVFTINGTFFGDIGLENTTAGSPNEITVTRALELELLRVFDTVTMASHSATTGLYQAFMPAYDNVLDYGGSSGLTQTRTNTAMQTSFYNNPAFLAGFLGAGTLQFRLDGQLGVLDVTGEGGKTSEGISSGESYQATLNIAYYYAAIPEPATASLLALGTLAFVFRRRRTAQTPPS